jgi:hypothetical protein
MLPDRLSGRFLGGGVHNFVAAVAMGHPTYILMSVSIVLCFTSILGLTFTLIRMRRHSQTSYKYSASYDYRGSPVMGLQVSSKSGVFGRVAVAVDAGVIVGLLAAVIAILLELM